MRITIETWGGFKIIIGNVGLGWRRGGVRAFSPDPLWRTWWELRLVVVEIGRDRLVPLYAVVPAELEAATYRGRDDRMTNDNGQAYSRPERSGAT